MFQCVPEAFGQLILEGARPRLFGGSRNSGTHIQNLGSINIC